MVRSVTVDPGPPVLPDPPAEKPVHAGQFKPGHVVVRAAGHNRNGDYDWRREYPQGEWIDDDLPEMLTRLSPRQRTYVAMRVRGESVRQAADRLTIGPDTGRAWEAAPWWFLAEQQEQGRFFGEVRDRLLPLVPDAVKRLSLELSGSKGEDIAHQSAIWVLERIGGKPTQKVEQKQETSSQAGDIVAILRETANIVAQMNAPAPPPATPALPAEVRELPVDE